MSLEAYWRQFGKCPTCKQEPMQPCLDMRYTSVVFTDKAHASRGAR